LKKFYDINDLINDSDDLAMLHAEVQGQKLRAYEEWLTHENERVEELRVLMYLLHTFFLLLYSLYFTNLFKVVYYLNTKINTHKYFEKKKLKYSYC
jgi:hypothetical protein